MLKEFGHEIWIADGPHVSVAGFRCPTRMAVIRLSDGGVFIWSTHGRPAGGIPDPKMARSRVPELCLGLTGDVVPEFGSIHPKSPPTL